MNADRLPLRLLLGWGVGTLGTATLLNALGTVQLFFFVNVLGISGTVAGSILFASKIYNLLTDTPMGIISDRTRGRWGRRIPWMVSGAVLCGSAFWLIFNPPAFTAGNIAAWELVFLLMYSSGYSLFNIPYIALAGEISESATERARLMSFRVGFMQVGVVFGAAGALLLVSFGGGERAGYGFMGAIVAWVVAVPMLIAAWASWDVDQRGAERDRLAAGMPNFSTPLVRQQLLGVLRNRPFMTLMLIKTMQIVATAVVSASILFFMKGVLGVMEKDVALKFGIPTTLGTLLFVPVWFRITERIGKIRAWFAATVIVILVLLSFLFARPDEPDFIFIARAFVFGVATSGILLSVQSLLTDTMQYDRDQSGERREGILSGVYSSVEKFAFALGPLLVGVLLDAGGYSKSAVTQTPAAERMIYFCVAVLPAIFYLLSLPVLKSFRFDPAQRGIHGK